MQRARLFIAAAVLGLRAIAGAADEPPHPPPMPGETLVQMDQVVKGQVAPPLTRADGSALLFQDGGGTLLLWHVYPGDPKRTRTRAISQAKIETGPKLGYSNSYPAGYASVETSAGVWFLGPSVTLIRPDGAVLTGRLPTSRNGMVAVGLDDGSVMAIGGLPWPEHRDFSSTIKVERVWLDATAGALRSEALAPLPVELGGTGIWESFFGFRALHLGGGRVMVTGDQYRKFTLLYEPATRSWLKLAPMLSPRASSALLLLPDGRVWATGAANSSPPYDLSGSSELWDPKTRTWQRGPDLPAPMQQHQALWVASKGVALLGAGVFPVVLSWKPGEAQVHIAAQTSIQRLGGALVPLDGDRLAIVSGVEARVYSEAYGRRSPGASVVTSYRTARAPGPGIWQTAEGGGLARRGAQLLAIGGTLTHSHRGSVANVGTRLVQWVDLGTGMVTTLPPLGFDTERAEVAWLDGQRALVSAERTGDGQIAQLGIIDVRAGQYSALDASALKTHVMSDGVHDRVRLVGSDSRRAWLVGQNGAVHWLDTASAALSDGPRMHRQRTDFTGRVLDDGRVVIAGGTVEGELVASRPADCPECAVRYVGWGQQLPSRRHEIFDATTQAWSSSAPSRAAGGSVAILADGRVAKAGTMAERVRSPGNPGETIERRVLVEISSADGSSWRTLPWPQEMRPADDEKAVRVFTAMGREAALPNAVFLGVMDWRREAVRWWWLPSVDEAPLAWRKLGDAAPPYFFPPGELDLGNAATGLRAFAIGSSAGVAVYTKPAAAHR